MRKLYVAKERGPDQGHESDLRGLGDEPVFKEVNPVAVLLIEASTTALTAIRTSLKEFASHLYFSETKSPHQLHISVLGNREEFKHHLLLLFGAVLYLYRNGEKNVDFTARLHLENTLHDLLAGRPAPEQLSWDGLIDISYPCNLYLQQSGFNLPSTHRGVALGAAELEQILADAEEHLNQLDQEKKAA